VDTLSAALLVILGAAAGALVVTLLWLRERPRWAAELARLQAERDGATQSIQDQRSLLEQTRSEIRDTFATLSKNALAENRHEFIQNADMVLTPVLETLGKVQTTLTDVDKAREGTYQAVSTQLQSLSAAQEQLRSATEGLTRSLRSSNVRGKWGEVQLRRILELSGMLAHCDFREKESTTTGDGARQTPDVIVKLPGESSLVIDAKVPIDAFLSATSAATDAERDELLARHARQVRDHVRALGAKDYWRQFDPSPEFVVMFLPLEPLLTTAFEQDGTLLEQAASLRVIPATPMTLLALLKAVAYGWQQQNVARNAEEIQTLGRELYDRLATMVDHLETVGRNIKQAADGYDRCIGSLERKLLPSARRFKDLGVSSTKQLETPEALDLHVRRIDHDELTGETAALSDRSDRDVKAEAS